MQSDLRITRQRKNDVLILCMAGDVTSAAADDLLPIIDSTHRKILLDFSRVEYINSSGVALIIQVLSRAHKTNTIVRCSGLSPHFQKVFQMVGLARYTEFFGTTEEALVNL